MAEQRILITSDWGVVTAELGDNDAAKALAQMLPLTIEMSDHMRQEKTGNLPSVPPKAFAHLGPIQSRRPVERLAGKPIRSPDAGLGRV